jgi:hypothetical protein
MEDVSSFCGNDKAARPASDLETQAADQVGTRLLYLPLRYQSPTRGLTHGFGQKQVRVTRP